MNLELVIKELQAIDDAYIKDGVSYAFISTERSTESLFVIDANQEGLVHLALQLLTLAEKQGGHYHCDNASMLDVGTPFVLGYQDADWGENEST